MEFHSIFPFNFLFSQQVNYLPIFLLKNTLPALGRVLYHTDDQFHSKDRSTIPKKEYYQIIRQVLFSLNIHDGGSIETILMKLIQMITETHRNTVKKVSFPELCFKCRWHRRRSHVSELICPPSGSILYQKSRIDLDQHNNQEQEKHRCKKEKRCEASTL